MTLARTLGFVTRERMYEALSAKELVELEVAYSLDPWGPERMERLVGEICTVIDMFHRAKGTVLQPLDYMPFIKRLQPQTQSEDDMKAIWQHAVENWNT